VDAMANDLPRPMFQKDINAIGLLEDRQGKVLKKLRIQKIDCTLLSHARHSFMVIANDEWIAIKHMKITGRCVFMKTIYSIHIGV
jgi:hypothetical protein